MTKPNISWLVTMVLSFLFTATLSAQTALPDLNETLAKRDAELAKVAPGQSPQWYRGCLHTHSLWSDGNALPELVVKWYRDNGFDFMTLSDHTKLQKEEQRRCFLPHCVCWNQKEFRPNENAV